MEEKNIKLLNNYFEIFRQIDEQHVNAEDFEKFKAWAEIEPHVHAIFEVFEDFYQKMNAELTTQGIKDSVMAEGFDPATLANPQPILDIVNSTVASKSADGKFLGSLAGNWAKQKLAYNNITLHYDVLKLTEQLNERPDEQELLVDFIKQYNENMGSLTDLVERRFDKVDKKFVKLSDKITKVIKRISSMSDKVKDVPELVDMVRMLSGTVDNVAENAEKIQLTLDALGRIESRLETLKTEMVDGVDARFETRLGDFKKELLEEIKNLLDEREKEKMAGKGSSFITNAGLFFKRHWFKITSLGLALGMGLGMGHFIAATNNRDNTIAAQYEDVAAIYEMYNGEGSADGLSFEQLMEGLKGIEGEQHSQEDIDKIAGYDQAVADYANLMGELQEEYEAIHGEGSSEGKTLDQLLEGLVKEGGEVTTYEQEIVALYDKLFPEGTAQNLGEMLEELNGVTLKTEEDAAKIAEYDALIAEIGETYKEVTGSDPTGVTVQDMLDAIVAAIQSKGEASPYGRNIMLKLYSRIMNESGESLSDEELYNWLCELYELGDVYIENDGSDTYQPEK